MPLSKEAIGKRIAFARKELDMTQSEFSEQIGISEKYLSRIECGKQLPSIVIITKICEFLDISTDELLSYTTSKVFQNQMLHPAHLKDRG